MLSAIERLSRACEDLPPPMIQPTALLLAASSSAGRLCNDGVWSVHAATHNIQAIVPMLEQLLDLTEQQARQRGPNALIHTGTVATPEEYLASQWADDDGPEGDPKPK